MTIRGGSGFPVDLTVSQGAHNRIRLDAKGSAGDSWSRSLTVNGAAEVVRVLRGCAENAYLGAYGLPGTDAVGFRHFVEWDGDPANPGYELYDRSGNTRGRTLCTLDMAAAVALELALGRAISDAVCSRGREIWLLVSTGVLVGDSAAEGADQVVTRALAFRSRESACDHLREFMRPDVSDSRPEGAWDEDGNDDYTVDDALDAILEYDEDLKSGGDGKWTYDGSTRSYEWRLMRLGVRS